MPYDRTPTTVRRTLTTTTSVCCRGAVPTLSEVATLLDIAERGGMDFGRTLVTFHSAEERYNPFGEGLVLEAVQVTSCAAERRETLHS